MPNSPKHDALVDRLDSIEDKIDENNRLLKKIKRSGTWSFWFGIVKILVVLGIFYYGYVFIEPYLQQILEIFNSVKELKSDSLNIDFNGINVPEILKSISG
jgi:hypothetical protein